MRRRFNAGAWYYDIAERVGSGTPIYDSANGTYVATNDAGYLNFLTQFDYRTGGPLSALAFPTEAGLRSFLRAEDVPYLGNLHLSPDPFEAPRVALTVASQALSSGSTDTVNFDSAIEGPSTIFWGGPSNANRINVPEGQGGRYLIILNAEYDETNVGVGGTAGQGRRLLGFREVGTGALFMVKVPGDNEDVTSFGVSKETTLRGGRSYRVLVRQNSGGDMNVSVECSLRRVE